MVISIADRSDLPAILQLQYEAFRSEAELYQMTVPPMTQRLSELEEEYRAGTVLKAIVNGEIVGSVRACIQDGVCMISKLIVKPDYQNQGIGKRLFREIEANYPHVKRKELFTGHKSAKNLAMYSGFGYEIFKEIVVNDGLTLVYMYKEV